MDNEKEKLQRFISAVNSSADKQVKEILDDARREEERIITTASAAAEEARQRYLNDNLKMASGKYVRMVSKAELDMKKKVLLCREELTKELFDKVTDRINRFRATDEYAELIIKMLSEENDLDSAQVFLSPEDISLADKIIKGLGRDISISSDETIKLGGFYILRSDKGTINDRTFDCAMREQHSLFASKNLTSGQEA